MDRHYLKVILDTEGTVLAIVCTLKDVSIKSDDYIGRNWFDTFIADPDKQKMISVFKATLEANNSKWKQYKNQITCPDGTYRYLDFINTVKYIDDDKVVESVGFENADT